MSEPSQFSLCNTSAKSFRRQWTDKDARTVIQWHDFITTTAQTFDVESEIFLAESDGERERRREIEQKIRDTERSNGQANKSENYTEFHFDTNNLMTNVLWNFSFAAMQESKRL